MDLSRLKWPIIIVVVALAGWLMTEGGTNWVYKNLTATPPGTDQKADEANEAGLSRLGGFLMKTFRYERARQILNETCERYPQGKNYYHNFYRLVKLDEKAGDIQGAVKRMDFLMQANANSLDERVPDNDTLQLRRDKLLEINQIGEVGQR